MSGGLSDKKAVLLGPQHREGEQSRGAQAVQASHTTVWPRTLQERESGGSSGGQGGAPKCKGKR